MLVHAFIMGRIDNCNSLLYGLPTTHINKLQRMQNAAAKLICSTLRFSHVTPMLFSLHWLPIKFRIDFKILIITFKSIHGQTPDYMCNLINVRNFSRMVFTRILNICWYHHPRKRRRHLVTGLLLLLHHHSGINCRVQ